MEHSTKLPKSKKEATKLVTKFNRPDIRMNLTTKLRLLKANPLLTHELEKQTNGLDKSNKSSVSITNLAKANDVNLNSVIDSRFSVFPPPKLTHAPKSVKNSFKNPTTTKIIPRNRFESKTVTNSRVFSKSEVKKAAPSKVAARRPLTTSTKTLPIRRSLSFSSQASDSNKNRPPIPQIHHQTITNLPVNKNRATISDNRPISFTEIRKRAPNQIGGNDVVPIFKTPSAYRRRSIALTPSSICSKKPSTIHEGDASKRLKEWLLHRGKNLDDFYHLKCFEIRDKLKPNGEERSSSGSDADNDEDKENVETDILDRGSYDNLRIVGVEEEREGEDLSEVAKGALIDLHNLILEGYTVDQCEFWLDLIKQKSKKVEDEPEYWECRAALEQSRGNFEGAVECYKTAIIEGAKVQVVDDHLDQLWQKFRLLDIAKESAKKSTNIKKTMNSMQNIFKSSIIQFAVQERNLKKKQKEQNCTERQLTATPVRRSTRKSRSAYVSTPGITVYTSLKDVDESLKKSINFKTNNALLE